MLRGGLLKRQLLWLMHTRETFVTTKNSRRYPLVMFVVCRGCLKEPFFSNLSDKIDNLLVPNSFMKSRMKSQSWLLWRIGIFMLQSMRWITQTLSSLRTKPRTYVIREVSITLVMIPCWLDPIQKQIVSNTSQTWTSGFTKWCAWSSIFVFCYGLFFSDLQVSPSPMVPFLLTD